MRSTSSRDNWVRLVEAVIKSEQIWQLCHQDSITTVDSDFTQRDLSLRSVPSSSSRLPLATDSVVQDIELRKNGSGTITQKIFSALLWRKKHKDDYYDLGKELVRISEDHFGLKSFSLRELRLATDNFYNKNILGRGELGNVYKGRLADGSVVAVKIYEEQAQFKFEEELEILSIVKHRNVVCPLGVCVTEKNWLIVYPYTVNGSVASCLRERREPQPPLGWETRLRIALGVARALDYLHHGCIRGIIHRDVKAANILLDEDFKAVVSDFSLATFMDNIDDVVTGTIGHIAPEYLSTGMCSWKTDVFSYGMFLLELITAQRTFDLAQLANDDDVMVLDRVKTRFEEKMFAIIVDQDLEGNFVEEEVEKLFQIALICTQTDPEGRPTMSEIVRMLEYGDGFDEGWEKFKNVYQDENYSSKLLPSAEWIMTNDLGKELVGIPEDHFGLKSFSLRELQLATDNFNNQNFLGRGGFGNVYKGRLADGSLVAVKRYKELAEVTIEQELEILSIVKHRNVIGHLGFCITEKERLIVYPYMANGSVASCLRERRESQPPLGWETRLRIALGVARALDYLHHGCIMGIIHRDVKAANILLNEDFEAVVSDFSLAIFMDNIDYKLKGTIGHIAPEYLATSKCSLETDVFGYGIFLLELITAQRAFDLARLANDDDVALLDWVKNLLEDKTFKIIVDPYLKGNYVDDEVEKLLQIVLICTQTDPEGRPTMSKIVRMLEYGDGLGEAWEELSKNVNQDQNYSSNLHLSADSITTDSCFSIDAEELSGPR